LLSEPKSSGETHVISALPPCPSARARACSLCVLCSATTEHDTVPCTQCLPRTNALFCPHVCLLRRARTGLAAKARAVARARGRECHRLVSRRHFHRRVSRVNRRCLLPEGGQFAARMASLLTCTSLPLLLLLPPPKFPRPAFPCAHHETAGLGAPCHLTGLVAALPRFAGLSSIQGACGSPLL
jgi:hypothetical protein